jgi:hypothetical protein
MDAAQARDEILRALNQNGAAMARVCRAYYERRTPERDLNWLMLQAGKELNAMLLRLERASGRAHAIERGVSREAFAKLLRETWEEMQHYNGLADILQDALGGGPLPVDEMLRYRGVDPHPDWPAHSARVLGVQALMVQATPWVCEVIQACNEGGDAAFHWAMGELPPDDDFLRRVAEVERAIATDEVEHGPEAIAALAETVPSPEALADAVTRIRQLGVLNVHQRNEQFLHPLTPAEAATLAADLTSDRLPPLALFRAATPAL